MFQDIEAKELSKAPVTETNQYIFIDVRTDEEFKVGHIPDAIHIPYDQMEIRLKEISDFKDKKILLICHSGYRSKIAAQFLAEKGFSHLYNLKGGMKEWTGLVNE
jgi:rhodanese-related sulfurtransferase